MPAESVKPAATRRIPGHKRRVWKHKEQKRYSLRTPTYLYRLCMLTLELLGSQVTQVFLRRKARSNTAVVISPNGIPSSIALITDHFPVPFCPAASRILSIRYTPFVILMPQNVGGDFDQITANFLRSNGQRHQPFPHWSGIWAAFHHPTGFGNQPYISPYSIPL